jgi:DNA repair ATPase RecN
MKTNVIKIRQLLNPFIEEVSMAAQKSPTYARVQERRSDNLDTRLTQVEVRIDQLGQSVTKFEAAHDGVRNHMQEFQVSVSRLGDSVERLKSVEGEIRALRDKLLTYEAKFQSIDEVKRIVWAVMLAVMPGFLATLIEVSKFLMHLHGAN